MVTPIQLLEKTRLSRFHYLLLTISSLTYALTAMNVLVISVTLPPIIREWGLDEVEAGVLASFGYIGMFFGAIVGGYLSDKIGRKATMALMVGIGSIFTGLCGLASDYLLMSILRLIAGIGLGGTLPLPGVYMSEYPPAKYRGRFVGIVETAWVYGALLAILVGFIIIPSYGWRQAFLPSYLPILLVPVILLKLPESVRYLIDKGRLEDIREIIRRYGLAPEEKLANLRLEKTVKYGVRMLFKNIYARRTAVLWVLWASLVYTYHGIFIWLPTIYARLLGYTIVKSLFWVLVVTLVQIPGYYSAALLLDRVGRKPVLVSYLVVAGAGSALLATATNIRLILLFSSIISFFNLGAWAGLYTYTPELYPTELRGTGSGIAASIGRLAGIFAPSITGLLFSLAGGQLFYAFMVFALVHIVAGSVVLFMGEETRGRVLEEISR